MKTFFRFLLVAACVLTSARAAAQEESCQLTVAWGSTVSHGWTGNDGAGNRSSVLRFYQDGFLLDTLSPQTGNSGTLTLNVSGTSELVLRWGSGDYDSHCSFSLLSASGALLYRCAMANFGEGDTVLVLANPCTACGTLTGLHVDSLGYDAVWLAWDEGSGSYQIEVSPHGFIPGDGWLYEVDTNALLVDFLDEGAMYDVYAYNMCDGEPVGPAFFSFIVPGAPVEELPYVTGFEPGDDCGWQFVQGEINQWLIDTAAHASGDFALYISNDNGHTNAYSNVPAYSYAYRTLTLPDTGLYVVSFDYRVAGNDQNWLRAFLVPDSLPLVANQFIGAGTFSARINTPAGWKDLSGGTPRFFSGHTDWTTKEASVHIDSAQNGAYKLVFLWANDNSNLANPPAAVDNIVVASSQCPAPSSFAVSQAGAESLTLDWVAGGSEELWQLSVDGGAWKTVEEHPYTVDSLMPGTPYTLRVRAVCDDDNSLYATLSAFTACPDSLRIYPYTERFEAYETGSSGTMNPCWSKGTLGVSSGDPYVSSLVGNRFLQFDNWGLNGGNHGYVVLPPVAGDVSELELSLDLRAYSVRHTDTLLVCLVPDEVPVPGSIDTVAVLSASTAYFVHHTVRFTGYEGSYRRVALISPASYFNLALYNQDMDLTLFPDNSPQVDNVRLRPTPVCYEPDDLVLAEATDEALLLRWDSVAGVASYVVNWRRVGDSDWDELMVDEAEAVIDGLEPGTDYEVGVSSVCGEDIASDTATALFRTLCAPVSTFPFVATFSTADELDCWTIVDADNNSHTWAFSADNHALQIESNPGSDDWAIMPAITLPADADGMILNYQVASRLTSGSAAYQLLISTTGVTLDAFDTVVDETVGGTFVSRSLDLDAYAGQTIHIAFRYLPSLGGAGMLLDNVRVRSVQLPDPVLAGPASANVGFATVFTASLSEGSLSNLTFDWQSTLEAAGHAVMTLTGANNDTLTITYDTLGTDTIVLVANNDYGMGTTRRFVQVVDLVAASLPYSSGFEVGQDTLWRTVGTTNRWHLGSATAQAGSRSLYVSADGGATPGYDITAPAVSYALRAINIAQEADYTVDFDWAAVGEDDSDGALDYFRAFLVPVDADLQADVIPDGVQYTAQFSAYEPDGWIDLVPGTLLADTAEWHHHSATVTVPHDGLYYLAFLWLNDDEDGSGVGAAIDNVRLRRFTCSVPTDLVLDAATTSSLTVHWTPSGSESQWLVEADGQQQVVATPSAAITGLADGVHYSVSVRALCSADDTSAALTAVFATETDCAPVTLPWTDDFSGWSRVSSENFMHPCWQRFYVYPGGFSDADNVGGGNASNAYLRSDDYYSATNALMMYGSTGANSYFSLNFQSVAVLPVVAPLAQPGVSVDLSVRFFELVYDSQTDDTTVVDFVDVGYLASNGDPTSFVQAGSIGNVHTNTFLHFTVDMPSYQPSMGRLALRYRYTKPEDFYYVAIDDVTLRPYDGPSVDTTHTDTTTTAIGRVEPLGSDFVISPNPATASVVLRGVGAASTVEVLTLNGQVLVSRQADSADPVLDIESLPAGVYFVRVTGRTATGSASVSHRKLVKL